MAEIDGWTIMQLREAAMDQQPVSGLTHCFYNYPARFSPLFARTAIRSFTEPGDIVLDPFMGGGTTLVEACALGRRAIGADVNSLAVFISKAKTTVLKPTDLLEVETWGDSLDDRLNLRRPRVFDELWEKQGYQRNINTRHTWRIRKLLELALGEVPRLTRARQQRFARCVLLKTAQWALDCRTRTPNAAEFREQLHANLDEMMGGIKEYTEYVVTSNQRLTPFALCLDRSAVGIEMDIRLRHLPRPKLILTSPPYPGVHVLYHRWQVMGRRETPAPYWLANSLDGRGEAYYCLGSRKESSLDRYYTKAEEAFRSLARIADKETIVVQMVAFSQPEWQIDRYVQMMANSGFEEIRIPADCGVGTTQDGRLWRSVPHRRWYATSQGDLESAKEVVLFHRLARC